MMIATVLSHNCTGPNDACRKAHRDGRSVHMIPDAGRNPGASPALIMPMYHYATEDDGRQAINRAIETAPTVTCDEDLYTYRRQGVAHFLPVGWIDPTRR